MTIRGKDRNREEAELFFEYLRESADYKELCELIEQGKPLKNLPKKYQPALGPIQSLNPLVLTYMRYGNVHTTTFETWFKEKIDKDKWPGYKRACVKDGLSEIPNELNGLSEICNDLIGCLNNFRNREGREPIGEEVKDELLSWMKKQSSFKSYFVVYRNQFSSEETQALVKEFHALLNKNNIKASGANLLILFLQAYQQMKKGIKVKDMRFPEVGDNFPGESEIYRWIRCAKRIIKNAEHGVFPGSYR